MNAEIQALWAADLRAHPELQGKNFLKTPDGQFCCLGRLCELAVQAGVIPPPTKHLDGQGVYGKNEDTKSLPSEVMVWAGLKERNPQIPKDLNHHNRRDTFALINDNGVSFEDIADYVAGIK